jgi:hypothetical protein
VIERNNDEERLARIEQIVGSLQHETAAMKLAATNLVRAVAVLTPRAITAKAKRKH